MAVNITNKKFKSLNDDLSAVLKKLLLFALATNQTDEITRFTAVIMFLNFFVASILLNCMVISFFFQIQNFEFEKKRDQLVNSAA